MIKVGLGYDLHKLVKNRPLMIGGINIPYDKGEDGHSDGDALLHAITDALLGAAGISDIGELFPPKDPTFKDVDSKKLLSIAWEKVQQLGWKLENIDAVIALEKPKFLTYRDQVRKSIANVLNCDKEKIFIKAKTGEKLGIIGKNKAIAVWAVCLLTKL